MWSGMTMVWSMEGEMRAFAVASLVVILEVARASASSDEAIVYGAGMVSCGEWHQYRENKDSLIKFQLQSWVDGYLSGVNLTSVGADFLLPRPNPVAYYAWIDNYCGRNPLDVIAKAAFQLRRELQTRAGR
jgi:hypothetical protein